MTEPEIELRVGEKTVHHPVFTDGGSRVHLRLEEPIEVTRERKCVVFPDIKITNPDGWVGFAKLSNLCGEDICLEPYYADLASWVPKVYVQLPHWKEDPVMLQAGTPIVMYRYIACDYDECGHESCEPRNKLRLERRRAKMGELLWKQWLERKQRVQCRFLKENPIPVFVDKIIYLRAERDILVTKDEVSLAKFDVCFDVPFGWHVRCFIDDTVLEELCETQCLIWDEETKPTLELRLKQRAPVEEKLFARGDLICCVEMVQYRCDCPKCRLLQNERNAPRHTFST